MLKSQGLPGGAVGKNQPANSGDTRDVDSIPGSRRSPGGKNGNPVFLPGKLHGLRSLADHSLWVYGVAKSGHYGAQTQAKSQK